MNRKNAIHPHAADRVRYGELGAHTAHLIEAYLEDVATGTLDRPVPEDQRRKLMSLPLPETGQSVEEILAFLRREIMPWPIATGHPRSYAWVNPAPAPAAVLADQVATAMNTGVDGYDHSSIFLNIAVGRWLMELTGFGNDGGFGVLFSGGSAAALNAFTSARHHAALEDGWDVREEGTQGGHPPFTIYVGEEAHSSIVKCAEQLGIGRAYVRVIPGDALFRLQPALLSDAIAADREAGLRPMAVAAAAGSTNVGAVDPLSDIVDICAREGLWLHVDGAYGGFGGLDPDYAEAYAPVARADTLTVDPHKMLQTPADCGALLMRHPDRHRAAFSTTPDYLLSGDGSSARWTYEHMFQLTYANRVPKTMASIARLGREGLSELVTRCHRLARLLGKLVEGEPNLELLAPVSLSVVNYRYLAPGTEGAALDDFNKALIEAMNWTGEVHLESTRVKGQISIRVCILHYDNCEDDIHHLIATTKACAHKLLAAR